MFGEKINATYAIPGTAFTVAAEWAKDGLPATTATSGGQVTAASAGLSYAVTKDFSLAGTYAKAGRSDGNGGTTGDLADKKDEVTKIISAGYSLGPVAVKGQYRATSNIGGLHGQGGEKDFLVWSGVNF